MANNRKRKARPRVDGISAQSHRRVDSAVRKRTQRLDVVPFQVVQREQLAEDFRVHHVHADEFRAPAKARRIDQRVEREKETNHGLQIRMCVKKGQSGGSAIFYIIWIKGFTTKKKSIGIYLIPVTVSR